MSYETYRTDLFTALSETVPHELIQTILSTIDVVSARYDIKKQSTDIVPYDYSQNAVRQYIASKAVEQATKGTLKNYYSYLEKFFNDVHKPIQDVTTNDIRSFLYRYEQQNKIQKSSLEHIRTIINSFFEWAMDEYEDIMRRNPARRIKPIKYNLKKQPRMNPMELEKMRAACKTLREKALVEFMYSTGARVSEIANARIADVNLTDGTFHIKHGKGDKERIDFLNPKCIISLKAYLNSRKDDTPYLFVTTRRPYSNMSSKSYQNIVKNIVNRTDINKKITPHGMRRTMATIGTDNGMPIQEMQKLLGHSNISTTMRYVDVSEESIKHDHRKYIA